MTTELLKQILTAGKRVRSEEYHRHCRTNHVATFYYFVKRLCAEAKRQPLLSTELNTFILMDLAIKGIAVNYLSNPQGWWGRAWTNWKDPSKHERHFRNEYYEVLSRFGKDPYSYEVKSEWFAIAEEICEDLERSR